jgi:hypothetical protein
MFLESSHSTVLKKEERRMERKKERKKEKQQCARVNILRS